MAGESIIETMLHKMEMIRLGNKFIMNFMERMREHDDTKLSSPEVKGFDAMAAKEAIKVIFHYDFED